MTIASDSFRTITVNKITYNGKHYTCLMDGCVWTPDAYPQGEEA